MRVEGVEGKGKRSGGRKGKEEGKGRGVERGVGGGREREERKRPMKFE